MSQPYPPSGRPPIPWVLRSRGRLLMSLLAAGLGGLATARLPGEVGLTICFDLAAIVYVGLFVALMNAATPEHAAELSSRSEPSDMRILAGVIILSLISVTAVGALQHPNAPSHPVRMLHLGASLAAIFLAWLLAHIRFGLHYMRMYYNDTIPDDASLYNLWMDYPERKTPDYWDFMYYCFAIAMCYQTSDVTITTAAVRRVTLLHAIFSFFFVAAIIGLVVNILSNVI